MKTFFGTTKNWDGPEIINEILLNNAAKKLIAARFITKKLWEFFAHPTPAGSVLDALAPRVRGRHEPDQPRARLILNRPEFYCATAKQGLVRTPIEWIVALCYYTGIDCRTTSASRGVRSTTGQQMYQPPNVAGWKPNAYWLNTSALAAAPTSPDSLTWWLRDDGGVRDGNVIYSDDGRPTRSTSSPPSSASRRCRPRRATR